MDYMRFTMFTSFAPAGPPGMAWHHPKAVDFDYLNLSHWVRLAKALEAAKFDGIFWADHSSAHDTYQGSWKTSVREAVQFPLGDPVLLAAALAGHTENLGFAFSANIIQEHPYAFARRLSTLDHLAKGRVAWNIVTSFQKTAWLNLGHDDLEKHKRRYERAQDYMTVLYKLLEGSWSDDAVVRDVEARVYADPDKVRSIDHDGPFYSVHGISSSEPSAGRMPLLFQAGASEEGREFSAKNAEAMFIAPHHPAGAKTLIGDMSKRLQAHGRIPSDLLYFVHRNYVIGSTEEEAQRKDREIQEQLSSETTMAFSSSHMGVDLAQIELDTPIGDFKTEALQGQIRALAEAAPDKNWTFRDVVTFTTRHRFVGTPDQAADELEEWREAGVSGINVTHMGGTEEIYDFIDHATPVFKKRNLMQSEYRPGSLREKFFAGTPSASGPRINQRHLAATFRA